MIGKLKKIDLMDVMGWIAESWGEIEPISLVRSWRKLSDHSRSEFEDNKVEADNLSLVDLMKRIPGYEEATDGDVKEWMGQDENSQVLDDGETVALMKENEEKDDEESEEEHVEDNEKDKKR